MVQKLISKYSAGILLVVALLTAIMLYIFKAINLITGEHKLTEFTFALSRISLWIVLIGVLFYAKFVEKGEILIWKDRQHKLSFFLISIIVLYFTCLFGSALLNGIIHLITHEKISERLLSMRSLFKNNFPLIFLTCFTAGFVEEFLMRGYIQPRLKYIYKNKWIAIIGSAVIFALFHATYGTLGQVVGPLLIGLVFAIFYEKYRNIKILIIVHFLIDFISLMILSYANLKSVTSFFLS